MLKKSVFLICCSIILAASTLAVLGQDRKIALKDKRITIQMTEKPLYTIFLRLIHKYDIAIGFEESILDRNHGHYYFETNIAPEKWMNEYDSNKEFMPPMPEFKEHLISVNFKDAKLEDVMNEIVKQMKHYDWEINDDVVNIFPVKGRDARLKKLLDVKVKFFGVGMGDQVGTIQGQILLFLPEFKAFAAENKLEPRTDRPGGAFGMRVLPDGMGFTDLTFKQLLNAVTKSKRGGWILQIKNNEEKPGQEFIEVFI
jgi:hypothetical protein